MQEENTSEKESSLYSEFAYDDAFRTMETECDDIVIPFVNYFYNESYDKTAVITRMRNEHFIEHQDKSDEKRITDSHFTITYKGVSKKYHYLISGVLLLHHTKRLVTCLSPSIPLSRR